MLKRISIFLVLLFSLCLYSASQAAPKPELLPQWQQSDETNTAKIDHSSWQSVLDDFLTTHNSGINRFNYKALQSSGEKPLTNYVDYLLNLDPREYNKKEQFAYWVNLYNAATVALIIDNYPIKSITKIKSGVFSFGPWDKKWITVAGETLSLNDIEHRILRPIWQDNRIHYAVNCASLGCPNLSKKAFTADNTEQLLEQASSEYINHPRGVSIKNGKLEVSSIYHWYLVDFGNNSDKLIEHLKQYAKPELNQKLALLENKKFTHNYDWNLNQ